MEIANAKVSPDTRSVVLYASDEYIAMLDAVQKQNKVGRLPTWPENIRLQFINGEVMLNNAGNVYHWLPDALQPERDVAGKPNGKLYINIGVIISKEWIIADE